MIPTPNFVFEIIIGVLIGMPLSFLSVWAVRKYLRKYLKPRIKKNH